MTEFAGLLFEIVTELNSLKSDTPVPQALIQRMEACLAAGLLVLTEMAPRWTPPDFIVRSRRLEGARSKLSADQLCMIRAARADADTQAAYRDLMVRLAHALDAAKDTSTPNAVAKMN